MDILEQIDRAAAGVCPCGADPRPGSAYCCDDCVPNYHARDTTSDRDGTAMRWRPDLVTAVDDTDLTLVAEFPVGRRSGRIYERAHSDVLHLRLDDGFRYVGTDVAPDQAGPAEIEPGLRRELDAVWQRLERELGNTRHLESSAGGDNPLDDLIRRWQSLLGEGLHGIAEGMALAGGSVRPDNTNARFEPPAPVTWRRLCFHCGERTRSQPGRRPAPAEVDIRSFGHFTPIRIMDGVEDCDLCGNCRWPFPGPPLQVSASPDRLTVHFKVDCYGQACSIAGCASHRAEQLLQQAEQAVLASYAQGNPDRPDVQEWLEAKTAYETRLWRIQNQYIRSMMFSSTVIDPRSITRIISTC